MKEEEVKRLMKKDIGIKMEMNMKLKRRKRMRNFTHS
jgi:hypothetical protein